MANKPYSFPPSSPMDHLLMQTLMSRLHLHSPSTQDSPNSLFSDLLNDLSPPSDEESADSGDISGQNLRRRAIAKEEAKIEKEIVRIIRAGHAEESLKVNSGQSVSIGEHNICVGVHKESAGNYRVWEWHGHVMMFDEEDGFNAEYVYGNYFERLSNEKVKKVEKEEQDLRVGGSGLKDLIGDSKDSSANGRVLHRNFVSAGSSMK